MKCALHLVVLASVLAPTGAARTADWPWFQGPGHDGVSYETGWSPAGAAAPLWRANVGRGYSCPSVVDGKLVTMGYEPEDEGDYVVCLDARTGEELWRHGYEARDTPTYHEGGTLTTPAIHDGVVYTTNREGRAFALDLAVGTVIWQRDYREELDLEETFHGYCASPLVLGDRLVLLFGGTAAAVDRATGALLWRTEDYGDGAYTNPTPVTARGRAGVAAVLSETFLVLDVETGEILHELPWELTGNSVHVAAPLALGERVFLSTAYNKGCAMLRLGEEVAPEVEWESRRMRNKVTGCFLHDGHIYGFDESILKCLDLDGNEQWRVRGLGMGALSIVGGRLVVLSSEGELIVAEATPAEFRELSRRKVLDGGVYWTMPVLVDGLLYARNSLGDLVCLDHRASASSEAAGEGAAASAPPPQALYAGHARAIGADVLRGREALRLTGHLEILGRGLARTPMTLTLVAPHGWDARLEGDGLVNTFDGTRGWTLDPRGPALYDDEERYEARHLFSLRESFAPAPAESVVEGAPVLFGGRRCWKATSTLRAGEERAPRALVHYFDVETGRLAGREGDGLSTLVYAGTLEADGVKLPARIVRFRPDDGQEETYTFARAEWIEPDAALFAPPAEITRLQRSPAEVAAENAALRARFAREVGEYEVPEGPLPKGTMELFVEAGELWLRLAGEPRHVDLGSEDAGRFTVAGTGGATIGFRRAGGAVTALELRLPVEDGFEEVLLPRVD